MRVEPLALPDALGQKHGSPCTPAFSKNAAIANMAGFTPFERAQALHTVSVGRNPSDLDLL